ncbi:MAG: hypothetical protein WEC00_08400 [Dongiaceae bacterium]
MTVLLDVLKELRGMFLADAKLSSAILGFVAFVAVLIHDGLDPTIAGFALLAGCLTILAAVTALESGRRGRG